MVIRPRGAINNSGNRFRFARNLRYKNLIPYNKTTIRIPVRAIRKSNNSATLTVQPNIKKKNVRIRNADSLVISLNRSILRFSLSMLIYFESLELPNIWRLFNRSPKKRINNREDK